MQENGFWDDVKRAEEVTKECKIIKDKIERYENLVSRIDDIEVLAELAEEDEDTINEVIKEIRSIEKEVENYRVELLLSGEYRCCRLWKRPNDLTALRLSLYPPCLQITDWRKYGVRRESLNVRFRLS